MLSSRSQNMLTKCCRAGGSLYSKNVICGAAAASSSSISKRSIIMSPATNENAAHHFMPLMPMGWDFVDNNLRNTLESHGVNVDNLERKYNVQLQNDAEFNNAALPSEGSPLWGYIYANRLVKCKVELDTLGKSDEYLLNYLRAQIEELEQRLKRYYPKLNWKGEYRRQLNEAKKGENVNFENAKNEAIAKVVTSDGVSGEDKYVSLFGNNSFIDKYDENDKFNDFLPSNLESKMIEWFSFYYDHSSDESDANKYFDKMQKLEKVIATPMNALSKELKTNFGLFVLELFNTNKLDMVKELISTFKNASALTVENTTGGKGSVQDCLSLLDIKNGKISKNSSEVLGSLFFGNWQAGKSLEGKDVSEVSGILASAGNDRIALIYEALLLESNLKKYSIPRVFLTVLTSLNREYMSQFFASDDNIESFSSSNSSVLDNIVSTYKAYHSNQSKLNDAIYKFYGQCIDGILKTRKNGNKDEIARCVKETFCNEISNVGKSNGNVECLIVSGLKDYAKECESNGDVFGQLEGLTYAKYLENSKDSLFWHSFVHGLINPSRNGIKGDNLSYIADAISNNTSDASAALFGNVGEYLKSHGLLNESESGSIASNLSSLVTKEWDALKTACNEYNKSRNDFESAVKTMSFNQCGNFHFEHVAQTYDPLNIHLAEYRYLSPH